MKKSQAKYRAIENPEGGLVSGFLDDEGSPDDMGESVTKCRDDFVIHEDTLRDRLKDKIKDRKYKVVDDLR